MPRRLQSERIAIESEETGTLYATCKTGTDPIPSSSIARRVPLPIRPRISRWPRGSLLDLLRPEIDKPRVTLKPNVVHGVSPDSGITVHPGFLRGVAEYLIDTGIAPSAISVAEGGRR